MKEDIARNGTVVGVEKGHWIKFFSKYSKSCNIGQLHDQRVAVIILYQILEGYT
jgi:hypothetical protein